MKHFQRLPFVLLLVLPVGCASTDAARASEFQRTFAVESSDWSSTGRNDYFVLEPGYRLVFEDEHKKTSTCTRTTRSSRTKASGRRA